jgi:ketosteroid isomerase-like protein
MTTTDADLQRRLEEVGSVLTSGDAVRTGDLYTRDGKLLPPGSDIVTGREAVAGFWQEVLDSGIEAIEIEPLDVEIHRDTADRVGLASLKDEDGEAVDEVKFIEVWKREDGEWRIHRDIWNSNAAEE